MTSTDHSNPSPSKDHQRSTSGPSGDDLAQRGRPGGDLRRLALFFILTMAASWAVIWPAVRDRPAELSEVGWRAIAVAMPSVVGVLLALFDSPAERTRYFRRFLSFRLAWWRTLAVFYGLVVLLLVVLALLDPGGVATMLTKPGVFVVLVGLPVFALLTQGLGGPLEEAGWRGYALPKMLHFGTPLKVSVVLGLFHAAWHLPLFMLAHYPSVDRAEIPFAITVGLFFLHVVNVSIGLTWVFLNSKGSIWLAVLAHAIVNFVLAGQNIYELTSDEGLNIGPGFTGTVLGAITSTLMVVVLLAFRGPRRQLCQRSAHELDV